MDSRLPPVFGQLPMIVSVGPDFLECGKHFDSTPTQLRAHPTLFGNVLLGHTLVCNA